MDGKRKKVTPSQKSSKTGTIQKKSSNGTPDQSKDNVKVLKSHKKFKIGNNNDPMEVTIDKTTVVPNENENGRKRKNQGKDSRDLKKKKIETTKVNIKDEQDEIEKETKIIKKANKTTKKVKKTIKEDDRVEMEVIQSEKGPKKNKFTKKVKMEQGNDSIEEKEVVVEKPNKTKKTTTITTKNDQEIKKTTKKVTKKEGKEVVDVSEETSNLQVEKPIFGMSNWQKLKSNINDKKDIPFWAKKQAQEKKAKEKKIKKDLKAPMTDDTGVTKYLALDCEMVGAEDGSSMLARVVIINSYGNVIYDKHVIPREKVADYRTKWSGIRPDDLKKENAFPFMQVQKEVAEIIKDKIVVGHALHNDFQALLLTHPYKLTRDTTKYKPLLRDNGKPRKLSWLTQKHLGADIQRGEHAPDEDARAALLLYKKFKKDWEGSLTRKILRLSKKKKMAEEKEIDPHFGRESSSEEED